MSECAEWRGWMSKRLIVFVQKGSTLKVMEEFNIQDKQTSFYKYCPGTFGYTLVLSLISVRCCVIGVCT